LSLIYGFSDLIRGTNFVCAAALVRLQIDNLLRLRAVFLVDDQAAFLQDVLAGKEVRQIRDRFGQKMTDARLQDILQPEYPWLKEIYKNTSAYVHLSEKHFGDAFFQNDVGTNGELEVYIGRGARVVDHEDYKAAIEDMTGVTRALLTYLVDYIYRNRETRDQKGPNTACTGQVRAANSLMSS
jgi:hypothetical protein